MIIDFEKIEEQVIMNFKGGEGELDSRTHLDAQNRIMLSRLKPGAKSGLHKHEDTSEVIYCLSGSATFRYDNQTERLLPGQAHYCPVGHSHAFANDGAEDFVFLAVVPNHNSLR